MYSYIFTYIHVYCIVYTISHERFIIHAYRKDTSQAHRPRSDSLATDLVFVACRGLRTTWQPVGILGEVYLSPTSWDTPICSSDVGPWSHQPWGRLNRLCIWTQWPVHYLPHAYITSQFWDLFSFSAEEAFDSYWCEHLVHILFRVHAILFW